MSTRHPRNAEKTRAEIIEAATELFGSHGFHQVTVGDICAAAGLSRGGFYHHFADRKACFEAVWKQLQDDWAAHTASVAETVGPQDFIDPWPLMERTFRELFAYWAEPKRRQINLYDPLPALGWERIRELQDENGLLQIVEMLTVLEKVNDMMTARLVFAAITAATFHVGRDGCPPEEHGEAARAIVRLLRGLPDRS